VNVGKALFKINNDYCDAQLRLSNVFFVTCTLLVLNITFLLAGYLPGTPEWDALLIYKQEQRYEAWVEKQSRISTK